MLAAAFDGRHALLFAYGQTAAGKTHSLFGTGGGKNVARLDGIVPQIIAGGGLRGWVGAVVGRLMCMWGG